MQYFAWCNLTCPHALSRVFSALTMDNTVHVNSTPHRHLLEFHTVSPFQQLSIHHFIALFVQSFLRYHHHLNCFDSTSGATKFFSSIEPYLNFHYDFCFFFKYIFFPSFRSSLALFLHSLNFSQSFQQWFY